MAAEASNTNGSARSGRRRPSPLLVAVTVVVMIGAAWLAWALAEPHTLAVSGALVSNPQIPAQFDGVRIVFVSDIHAGRYYSPKRVAKLVDTINALKPDLVILGGDYVGGYSGGLTSFYAEAKRIKPPLGMVAVLGNHDGWEGALRSRRGLERMGASLLDNRNVRVLRQGATIIVGGVEDLQTGDPDVGAAATDIPADAFAILVSHNPDVFAYQLPAHAAAFDLALAGHVHGGQITLFGAYAPVIPSSFGQRYRGGWVNENGIDILVTRGVGTVDAPLRFFAKPEVNVIDLRRGPESVTANR